MISFVIPVYNEEGNLERLYQELKDVMTRERLGEYEILFVDDGSSDGSCRVLERLAGGGASVHVCSLKKNYGKSTALNVGFRLARGDIVFTMDADLQDDPEEIPRFLAKLREGFDMVSGWKRDRKDPIEKRVASKIFNFVVSKISGLALHDFNCGFKVYRKDVVDCIDIYGEFHRFIPIVVADNGYRIAEIAVAHHPRASGRSKYGTGRYLAGFFDFFSVWFTLKYSSKPFHFIGAWGLLSGAGGFLLLLYTAVMKYGFHEKGARPALFVGLFLLSFAVNVVIFGFIADLIVRNTRSISSDYRQYIRSAKRSIDERSA